MFAWAEAGRDWASAEPALPFGAEALDRGADRDLPPETVGRSTDLAPVQLKYLKPP